MKSFNPNLVRWIIALSLLGVCNVYGQDAVFITGPGGGGASVRMRPRFNFTPLPVKLIYFNAVPQDNYVVLKWATASEHNSANFIVERSVDGQHFQALQEVDAAGNSSVLLNYQTVDDNPIPGRSYYRLKERDWDGQLEYSTIVSVFADPRWSMSLYPTVASSVVNLELSADFLPEEMMIRIIDASGRVAGVTRLPIGTDMTTKNLQIDVSQFKPGLYLLQAGSEGGLYMQERFIIQ